jgi:hypothetical protein
MTARTPKKKTISNPAGWQQVATMLKAARIKKGFRLRSELVTHLVNTRQAKTSIDRILGDLERGARDNYSASTLAGVELWYGLPAGEIARTVHQTARAVTASSQNADGSEYEMTSHQISGLSGLPTIGLLHMALAISEELAARVLDTTESDLLAGRRGKLPPLRDEVLEGIAELIYIEDDPMAEDD